METYQDKIAESAARNVLPVQEIFSTVQGEARNTGLPCTFIRLFGCNMRCTYCDSGYFSDESVRSLPRERMTIQDILDKVRSFPNRRLICLTGGEPLIHHNVYDLVIALLIDGYEVEIETNGGVPILPSSDRYKIFGPWAKSVRYIMDIKTPCSGEHERFLEPTFANVSRLTSRDDIVFVISGKEDYDFAARNILAMSFFEYARSGNPAAPNIYLSPVNVAGLVDPVDSHHAHAMLPLWLIEDQLPNTRVQLQMHKFLHMP